MSFDTVLKKSSALLAAMLTMTAAWCFLHLPGANLQMAAFAFLSSSALCSISDFNLRTRYCIQMVCGAAAAQFIIGITADYPLMRIIFSALFSFFILSAMPERQTAVIVLITGCLTLFAQQGITASLNRCMDIVFAGAVVLLITAISNIFVSDSKSCFFPTAYTYRQAAIITAELSAGFMIFEISKHEQSAWIMLTVLFLLLAENPQTPQSFLAAQRMTATPLGILAGGMYLSCFCTANYRMIYIVPLTGTLSFFMLYLKNDYFIFTFLFMFTLTLFTDWMLGTGLRFHFTDIMLTRSAATVIGGVLLLCGKNLMQKETVS